ncbi:MAG: hypothetical protein GX224_01775 [Thermoplasmatales archaeon]|nr:hypothetical protein [Thermoplasmatales archaeon]
MKTRVVMVSGPAGSGKTSLVKAISGMLGRFAFMAADEKSERALSGLCEATDHFPMRTPCARPRQFSIRLERLLDSHDVPLVVSEPPGLQGETCAPILNPLFVFEKEKYNLGRLILTLTPEDVGDLRKNDVASQKNRLLIDEADVLVVTNSDAVEDERRPGIEKAVRSFNDACEIIFFSAADGEGAEDVARAVLEGGYSRPLVN